MNQIRSLLQGKEKDQGRGSAKQRSPKVFAGAGPGGVTTVKRATLPSDKKEKAASSASQGQSTAARLFSKTVGSSGGRVTGFDKETAPAPSASPSPARCRPLFAYDGPRLTNAELEQVQEDVAKEVKRWNSQLTFVKPLQEAKRNHGRVDLMELAGKGKFAVKRMPNRWMQSGPKSFNDKYPTTSEKPWVDVAIVTLLQRQSFKHVCHLQGIYRDETDTYVAWEFAPHGDLFAWSEDLKPGRDREAKMLPLVVQLVYAVTYLHEFGIAHRDLSLENVVLADDDKQSGGRVKLIDFGMATTDRTCRDQVCGKQSYRAPEMYTAENYDSFLSDTFAVGVIIYALAVQDYPWISTKRGGCQLFEFVNMYGLRSFVQRRKLRKGQGETLIEVMSPELLDMCEAILAFNPAERASLGESCWKERVAVHTFPWFIKGKLNDLLGSSVEEADPMPNTMPELSVPDCTDRQESDPTTAPPASPGKRGTTSSTRTQSAAQFSLSNATSVVPSSSPRESSSSAKPSKGKDQSRLIAGG